VDLHSFYHGPIPGQHVYRLRSLVCYYGAHYFAFVLLPDRCEWVAIDDARVSPVGSWQDVRAKCERGRVQPSMLFFEKQGV
jgi:ubiquitin C-terminal hydrolase